MDIFSYQRVFHDLIYFLMLVGLAMASINPLIVMPHVLYVAIIVFVIGIVEYKTGYISIAQSVCKIE